MSVSLLHTHFVRVLAVVCFLLGTHSLPAQQAPQGKVYVANNPGGPGISVRWAGPEISYQEGIKIYRRQGRRSWVLITKPIMPPTAVPTHLELTDNDVGIINMFLETDHKEFVEGFAGILTLMQSIKDYQLALALNIAYNDTKTEKGQKYSYKVEAILKGETILLGESEEIKCEDFEPIAAPSNLTFERKKRRTMIWWDNDPVHHHAYNLYVKKDSGKFEIHTREIGSEVIGEKEKDFIDLRTHKDTLYTIKIEALDYFGGKSVMSEEVKVEIQDFDPPTEPALLVKSDSKEATLTVSWQRPPEEDLAGYDLYRRHEEVDTFYTKLNRQTIKPDDTLYIDKVKEPGAYTYQLVAKDESGNEIKSLPETGEVADIIPPPVPEFVGLTADTGLFVIRWQRVKANDLRGYVVMRSVADEDNSDNIFVPASEIIDTNYFAEPISPNVRAPFVYVVRSVDTLLNYSLYSKEVIGQLPDVTPPVAPLVKSVEEEGEELRIAWAENVEKDLKGYNIYKRLEGDTTDFEKLNGMMVPADIAAYTDREVERGQSYEYYVEAVDFADLVSPASNIATGKLAHLALEGKIEVAKQKLVPTRSEFVLAWNGDDLKNEPLVGYAVFRSIDGAKALQRGKVSKNTQFKEKLSQPGKYEYHIRAYGERGNILYSDPITIELDEE